MACIKTGGSSGTKAGIELFQPTGTFALTGTDQKLSQQNPSAVLGGRTVTINYHVEAVPQGPRDLRQALDELLDLGLRRVHDEQHDHGLRRLRRVCTARRR